MNTVFVKAWFDLDCEWCGLPPIYRIFVNDELFAERTWVWTENYLSEMLQIQAPPGAYQVRVESVGPSLAHFSTSNHRVELGPARWDLAGKVLEITQETF